jgi:LysR family transcriptional regulator, glycine cleavage system transcriptional activator
MRSLPPLRLLAVFETVVRHRGVKAAARVFNVSPAAVSQSLKQLESHLGLALLDRSTRPPSLTQYGAALRDACAIGLKTIEDCIEEMRISAAAAERSITVACSVGTATYWLMPRLSGFYQRHGDITINVMTTTTGSPPLSGGVDVAIRYGHGHWRDGIASLLFKEKVVPVCTPQLKLSINDGDSAFERLPLIHVDVDDRNWLGWNEYFKSMGYASGRKHPGLRFTNYVQATQAALSSQGVMLGWQAVTGDLIAQGRLVAVCEHVLYPAHAHYAVIAERSAKSASLEAVCTWLVEEGKVNSLG